jgi:hypothetical protein
MHMLLEKVRQKMTNYGYARVSTNGQDLGAQIAELQGAATSTKRKLQVHGPIPRRRMGVSCSRYSAVLPSSNAR